MRHLHDTRAPFWTGIGTGSRAREVQDPNGGSRVRCSFWPHKKALLSSSLSFLAAKKTPYRYPFSAMQTSTRSIKTKRKKPKRQTSVSSLLLRRLEVTEKSGCESKAASRFFSLHGDKSTVSTLREGPFCSLQNVLYVLTHEGNFMRANQVCGGLQQLSVYATVSS